MQFNKKILFVTNRLTTGGAELLLVNIVNLIDEDYKVHIVTLLENDAKFIEQNIRADKVTLHAMNMPQRYIYFPTMFYQLYKLIKSIKPNLVHSFLFHSNVLARLQKIFFEFKLINSNFDTAEEKNWYLALQWLTKQNVDLVTIDNNIGKQRYIAKNIVSKNKIIYIPNGISISTDHIYTENLVDEIKTRINYSTTDKLWINISRFVVQKDHKTLISAFEIFIKQNPNNKLLLVGDGVLVDEIQKLIQRKKLTQNIFYLGRINDVFTLCKMSHFYVSSSAWEGMSIALMQAMRYNVPVIATQVGANVDLITNNVTGFLCERQNPQSLYTAMQSAYHLNAEQRRTLQVKACATIVEKYSLEKLKHDWCSTYEALLASDRP